ncbi:hypothetical protein K438DRAFT_1767075 [Mycena galopus ATCC 62051]|nr:hypothetical protein K438DRAFT_1767075 [Mycena galopus ATCC 62051]
MAIDAEQAGATLSRMEISTDPHIITSSGLSRGIGGSGSRNQAALSKRKREDDEFAGQSRVRLWHVPESFADISASAQGIAANYKDLAKLFTQLGERAEETASALQRSKAFTVTAEVARNTHSLKSLKTVFEKEKEVALLKDVESRNADLESLRENWQTMAEGFGAQFLEMVAKADGSGAPKEIPPGVFTEGIELHPHVSLAKVGELYDKLVVEKLTPKDLTMEQAAFYQLLERRVNFDTETGVAKFKLFRELTISASDGAPDNLLTIRAGRTC